MIWTDMSPRPVGNDFEGNRVLHACRTDHASGGLGHSALHGPTAEEVPQIRVPGHLSPYSATQPGVTRQPRLRRPAA
jgi:hypothetical protein